MESEAVATGPIIEEVKPVEKTKTGVVSNCERLNVRKNPNRNAEVLTIIEEDDVVNVFPSKSTRNWFFVQTESGVEGFCMADYVTLDR
jgi:uncharacterized protein YgiM (DUF1202 family)